MRNLNKDIERYYLMAGLTKKTSSWAVFTSCFNPRLLPIIFLRTSGFFYSCNIGVLSKFFSFLNFLLFGIETSPKTRIGGGLLLPHTIGTILGAESIGNNVTIMHGVTLGAKKLDYNFSINCRPVIGDNVFIGAGAKIIGYVIVGNNVTIGANAVVLHDVPAYSLAVGVPARVLVNHNIEQ